MKLSTKKICVRPQLNMATAIVQMKGTQKQSSKLENKSIAPIRTGTVQMGSRLQRAGLESATKY